MGWSDSYGLYASQNPDEAVPQQGAEQAPQSDPMLEAKFAPPPEPPAPYGGLTGQPFETAIVSMAQLQAHQRPKRQRVQPPVAPTYPQMAGLSALLGR